MSWRTGRPTSEFYAADWDQLRAEKARRKEDQHVPDQAVGAELPAEPPAEAASPPSGDHPSK